MKIIVQQAGGGRIVLGGESAAAAAGASAALAAASATSASASSAAAAAAAATVAAAVSLTAAAPRAPTATDDQAAGYKAFSRFLDTGRQAVSECIDPTPGQAVWLRRGHAGELMRRSGESRYYTGLGRSVTTTAPVVGQLHLRPIILHERNQVIGVAARSSAAGGTGANAGMKAHIWRDGNARPFGAPVASDAVGVALGATAVYNCLLAAILPPGVYWIGLEFIQQFDPLGPIETLPNMVSHDPNDWTFASHAGILSIANQAPQGFRMAKTWAAPAPTWTGSENWDAGATISGIPIAFLRLA